MGWLPLFLDCRGKSCLVIGGNTTAARKVEALLRAEAQVTILARTLEPELRRLVEGGHAAWQPDAFRPEMLDHVWLVVSAVEDESLNALLKAEADQRRIFINVVDRTKHCSAIWPAVVDRPPMMAAIASGGQFPAMTAWLRRKLGDCLPERLDDMVEWFAPWRQVVSQWLPDLERRGRFWREIFDAGVAELFLEGRQTEAARLIRQALEQTRDDHP